MVGAVFDGIQESDDGSTDIYKQHTDLERNTRSSAGSPDCLLSSTVLEIDVAFLSPNKSSRSGFFPCCSRDIYVQQGNTSSTELTTKCCSKDIYMQQGNTGDEASSCSSRPKRTCSSCSTSPEKSDPQPGGLRTCRSEQRISMIRNTAAR